MLLPPLEGRHHLLVSSKVDRVEWMIITHTMAYAGVPCFSTVADDIAPILINHGMHAWSVANAQPVLCCMRVPESPEWPEEELVIGVDTTLPLLLYASRLAHVLPSAARGAGVVMQWLALERQLMTNMIGPTLSSYLEQWRVRPLLSAFARRITAPKVHTVLQCIEDHIAHIRRQRIDVRDAPLVANEEDSVRGVPRHAAFANEDDASSDPNASNDSALHDDALRCPVSLSEESASPTVSNLLTVEDPLFIASFSEPTAADISWYFRIDWLIDVYGEEAIEWARFTNLHDYMQTVRKSIGKKNKLREQRRNVTADQPVGNRTDSTSSAIDTPHLERVQRIGESVVESMSRDEHSISRVARWIRATLRE